MIFFIPFVLAEVPANLVLNLNKIRPGILLGGQMFLLGTSAPPLIRLDFYRVYGFHLTAAGWKQAYWAFVRV